MSDEQQLIQQIQIRLEKENNFMENHINHHMETKNDFDPDFFSLSTFITKFVRFVLKKEDASSLAEDLGDVKEGMTLVEFINNQIDKDFYFRTIQKLHKKTPIKFLEEVEREKKKEEEKKREEEKKEDNRMKVDSPRRAKMEAPLVVMGEEEKDEEALSAEEKELQKIYGDKVVQILWMFENDEVARNAVEAGEPEVPAYGDEYGDEYGAEAAFQDPVKQIYRVVEGIGFQILDQQHCQNLESTYAAFLESQKEQETYIQEGEDVYQVKFSVRNQNNWVIKNTLNNNERVLLRQKHLNGPFITQTAFAWSLADRLRPLSDPEQDLMSKVARRARATKTTKARALAFNGNAHCLFVVQAPDYKAYILNLQNDTRWACASKQTTKRWDAVTSFRPPPELSIESGRICKVEKLDPNSAEYQLLAEQFLSTSNGQIPPTSGLFGGGKLSKHFDVQPAKPVKPARGGFGFA